MGGSKSGFHLVSNRGGTYTRVPYRWRRDEVILIDVPNSTIGVGCFGGGVSRSKRVVLRIDTGAPTEPRASYA